MLIRPDVTSILGLLCMGVSPSSRAPSEQRDMPIIIPPRGPVCLAAAKAIATNSVPPGIITSKEMAEHGDDTANRCQPAPEFGGQ